MVVVAAALLLLTRRIRLPSIVTYLVAGLIVGPTLGLVESGPAIELISELGIVLLLFMVGLELSLDKIRDVGPVAVVAGLGQVAFTAIVGFALCVGLGFTAMESLFLATGLTFSSTVVVVKLLSDKKDLNELYGRIAVGIFLVQDMVVILVLTVLNGLTGTDSLDVASLSMGIARALGGMALLLAFTLFASRFLLPKPFAWASRHADTFFIWSLCWCLLVVAAAHWLHLSIEVGAFLAGLALAQLRHNEDLRRRIHPLMDLFVAIFFVSLGMRMDLGDAMAYAPSIVTLSLFVLVGNPLIFFFIIVWMRYRTRTAFLTSVTVAQISEFSFIFAAMGVATGLVGSSVLMITAAVGVITIVASAYMILYNRWLYDALERLGIFRFFKRQGDDAPPEAPERSGHILVVGMNSMGRDIARRLTEKGETVVAIDTDPVKLEGLPCATLHGNVAYTSLLEEAGLSEAKLLVSALQIEDVNEFLAYVCQTHQVRCCINAVDMESAESLLDMDVAYLIFSKVDGLKHQNALLRDLGMLKT